MTRRQKTKTNRNCCFPPPRTVKFAKIIPTLIRVLIAPAGGGGGMMTSDMQAGGFRFCELRLCHAPANVTFSSPTSHKNINFHINNNISQLSHKTTPTNAHSHGQNTHLQPAAIRGLLLISGKLLHQKRKQTLVPCPGESAKILSSLIHSSILGKRITFLVQRLGRNFPCTRQHGAKLFLRPPATKTQTIT